MILTSEGSKARRIHGVAREMEIRIKMLLDTGKHTFIEPRYGKIGFLHMQKHRHRSASRLPRSLSAPLFRDTDSTFTLLPKSEFSSHYPYSVTVQPGLCRTWSESLKTSFLTTRLNILLPYIDGHRCSCLTIKYTCRKHFKRYGSRAIKSHSKSLLGCRS